MSALRNAVKLVLGSAIGAGVGYAASKALEPQEDVVTLDGTPVEFPHETFKERLTRAREAGEAARLAKEAELKAYFRQKVHDPESMTDNPLP